MNVGMVFAMIFTLILISMILMFAMPAIGNVFCLSSDAQVADTIKEFDSVVDQVYVLSEGSSRVYDLFIPGDAKFCFVDPDDVSINQFVSQLSDHDWNPGELEAGLSLKINQNKYNLWYTHCSGQNGYRFEHLQVSDDRGSFCVETGDSLYVVNKGTYVEVDFR